MKGKMTGGSCETEGGGKGKMGTEICNTDSPAPLFGDGGQRGSLLHLATTYRSR